MGRAGLRGSSNRGHLSMVRMSRLSPAVPRGRNPSCGGWAAAVALVRHCPTGKGPFAKAARSWRRTSCESCGSPALAGSWVTDLAMGLGELDGHVIGAPPEEIGYRALLLQHFDFGWWGLMWAWVGLDDAAGKRLALEGKACPSPHTQGRWPLTVGIAGGGSSAAGDSPCRGSESTSAVAG